MPRCCRSTTRRSPAAGGGVLRDDSTPWRIELRARMRRQTRCCATRRGDGGAHRRARGASAERDERGASTSATSIERHSVRRGCFTDSMHFSDTGLRSAAGTVPRRDGTRRGVRSGRASSSPRYEDRPDSSRTCAGRAHLRRRSLSAGVPDEPCRPETSTDQPRVPLRAGLDWPVMG